MKNKNKNKKDLKPKSEKTNISDGDTGNVHRMQQCQQEE